MKNEISRTLFFVGMAVLILVVIPITIARPEEKATREPGTLVDFKTYRTIKPGMTLEEVEDEIGATGYSWDDSNSIFVWANANRSGMRCYFVKGRLANKASIKNLR